MPRDSKTLPEVVKDFEVALHTNPDCTHVRIKPYRSDPSPDTNNANWGAMIDARPPEKPNWIDLPCHKAGQEIVRQLQSRFDIKWDGVPG